MLKDPLLKFGVEVSGLEANTKAGLDIVHKIFGGCGETLLVNGAYEGNHPFGSLYNIGRAFNIRKPFRQRRKVLCLLRSNLPYGFCVIVKESFWCVEYYLRVWER